MFTLPEFSILRDVSVGMQGEPAYTLHKKKTQILLKYTKQGLFHIPIETLLHLY